MTVSKPVTAYETDPSTPHRLASVNELPTLGLLQEVSKHARMGSNLGLPICLRLSAAMHGSVGIAEVRT